MNANAREQLEGSCPDHWHCDPRNAAHDCTKVDRTVACPTCGAKGTAITVDTITDEQIRAYGDQANANGDDAAVMLAMVALAQPPMSWVHAWEKHVRARGLIAARLNALEFMEWDVANACAGESL